MEKIFISYSGEDEEAVKALYEKLTKAGYLPWLDKETLQFGDFWSEKIEEAIENSCVFLACLSENSLLEGDFKEEEAKYGSKMDFYQEVNYALKISKEKGDKFLIPVKLGPCSIPVKLEGLHVCEPFEHEEHWLKLVRVIQERILESNERYYCELSILNRPNRVSFFPITLVAEKKSNDDLRDAFNINRLSIENELYNLQELDRSSKEVGARLTNLLNIKLKELNENNKDDITWKLSKPFHVEAALGNVNKLKLGDVLDSRYRLVARLKDGKEGRWCALYEVEDLHFDKNSQRQGSRLWMKLLKSHIGEVNTKANMIENIFQHEFEIFRRLDSTKNIAKFINYGRTIEFSSENAKPQIFNYLILEHIDGTILNNLKLSRDELSQNALDIVFPLSNAIISLHDLNVCHRDLRESNIIIPKTKDGTLDYENLKLIDLGLCAQRQTPLKGIIENPLIHREISRDRNEYEYKHDIFVIVQLLWKLTIGDLSANIWGKELPHADLSMVKEKERIDRALKRIPVPFLRSIIKKGLYLEYENTRELENDLKHYRRMCLENVSKDGVDCFAVTYLDYEIYLKFDENKDWRRWKGRIHESKLAKYVDTYYLKDWNKNFDPGCRTNFPQCLAKFPLVFVSYHAAKAYATWVNKQILAFDRNAKKTAGHFYSTNKPLDLIEKYGPMVFYEPCLIENLSEVNKKRMQRNGPLPAIPLIPEKDGKVHHISGNTLEYSVDSEEEVWLKGIDWLNTQEIETKLSDNDLPNCFLTVGFRCTKNSEG